MDPYCNRINLPFYPLIDYDIFSVRANHTIIPVNKINPEIRDLLNNLGIYVNLVELFYKFPGKNSTIHTDNNGGDYVKINWIYSGKNSSMKWYKPNINKASIGLTGANTEYIQYDKSEVTLVHETNNMQGSYIVQVGIPHYVYNPDDIRYCLCFVLTDSNKNRLSMDQATDKLSKFIV